MEIAFEVVAFGRTYKVRTDAGRLFVDGVSIAEDIYDMSSIWTAVGNYILLKENA